MPARLQLNAFVVLAVSTCIACSSQHPPSTDDEGIAGTAPVDDAATPAEAWSLRPGETLTTDVLDDATATATVLDSGDIQIELRDRTGVLLAKGWLSVPDRMLRFTILREVEGGGRRGEVQSVAFGPEITLENANHALAAQWLAGIDPEGETRAYRPYAPGCHLFTIPVTTPGRNSCVQNCCAIFDQWDHIYQCEGLNINISPERLGPCSIGTELYVSCIATCGLLPLRDSYGEHCLYGEHQCFDERCGGYAGKLYCANDCYSAPSECDVKPTGSLEYCNKDVGPQHSCEDGYQRKGYWALDCDTTMSSCECETRSLKRCTDDRCVAGRNGFCGNVAALEIPGIPGLPDEFTCDPSDTLSPCCGDAGQPCCANSCASGTQCVSNICVRCGNTNEPPCATAAGPRCNDGLDFRGTGKCIACGVVTDTRHPCCSESTQYTSVLQECSADYLVCSADKCTFCGTGGQKCCVRGAPCANGASCNAGRCPPCGYLNEPCCRPGWPGGPDNSCSLPDLTCQSGKCAPTARPDIVVDGFEVAPIDLANGCNRVTLWVRNAGNATVTNDFDIRVNSVGLINPDAFTERWTTDLTPGQRSSTSLYSTWGLGRVRVQVDFSGEVTETSVGEGNNLFPASGFWLHDVVNCRP